MRGAALAAGLGLATLVSGAGAHHVGVYTPKDNEVTANFKQIKSSVQARRFEVARQLFEVGAVRRQMRAEATHLPAGLEAGTLAALEAGDAAEVERHLMLLFAALARDLVREADRQLADAGPPPAARAAAGRRLLEAAWRYYNLVDFAVSQRDNRASVAVRLAFDDAESAGRNPAADPSALRPPLRRIAEALSALIETSSTRRNS